MFFYYFLYFQKLLYFLNIFKIKFINTIYTKFYFTFLFRIPLKIYYSYLIILKMNFPNL